MYRAELLKLRSTRAPWVLAAVAVGGMLLVQGVTLVLPRLLAGLGAAPGGVPGDGLSLGAHVELPPDVAADLVPDLVALTDVSQPAFQRGVLDLLAIGPGGGGNVGVSVLCMLLLGVLTMTADFRHGGIVPTSLVAPSRLRVLTAKAGATATVAVAVGVVLAVLTALGLFAAVATSPGAHLALGAGEVLGVWGRGLLVLVLFSWMGLAIGTLVRSQVAAVLVVCGLALAEPIVQALVTLLAGGSSALTAWLPLGLGALASAGQSAAQLVGGAAPMGVLAALAGLTAWVGALLAGGALSLQRRDLV